MKIRHTAYSNKSRRGMGGPGAGGCLRRSLSGWKSFKKNVYGRDLRSSQNSKRSVWISIRKFLTNASRCRGRNYKGPISQLSPLPCGASTLISKPCEARISSVQHGPRRDMDQSQEERKAEREKRQVLWIHFRAKE